MSFVIAALPFMRVAFEDDAGGPVAAFRAEPSARARLTMKNHSIIFRGAPSGFALHYLANPLAAPPPVAEISGRTRFSFALRLAEPDFFERFHPDGTGGAAHLLLDNLDAAGAIQTSGALSAGVTVEAADLVEIGPNPYPVVIDFAGGAPPQVEARDRFSNAILSTTPVVAEPGALSSTVLLAIPPDADPATRITAPAPSALDRLVYADDEPTASGAVGVIDLYWDQSQTAAPADTGAEFTAAFRPRP